jgi:hypothetical protein
MLPLVWTLRLAIVSVVWVPGTAEPVSHDPIKDFCRRHQHQTCVIDSKLYIDGGLAYYGPGVYGDSQPETSTRT